MNVSVAPRLAWGLAAVCSVLLAGWSAPAAPDPNLTAVVHTIVPLVLATAGPGLPDGRSVIPLPPTPVTQAASVGYLPASWEVSPANGQFEYTIPLDVPDGPGGLQPRLTLHYSSEGPNGILGVGWTVNGLSQITRCPRTIASDGMVSGINFINQNSPNLSGPEQAREKQSDAFCLDGEKLVAIAGLYGGQGTEYRTERESARRVISHTASTITDGPDKFVITTADGAVHDYVAYRLKRYFWDGDATPQNPSHDVNVGAWTSVADAPRLVWLIDTSTDVNGNKIRYQYTVDPLGPGTGNGHELLPYRISYSAAGNGSFRRYVEFHYATTQRPDVVVRDQAGIRQTLRTRLTAISMNAPNPSATAKVWEYRFAYHSQVSRNSRRSLLHSVKRCGALGGCLWAKEFDWDDGAEFPQFDTYDVAKLYPDPSTGIVSVADFTGDGLDDVLYGAPPAPNGGLGITPTLYAGKRTAAGVAQPLADTLTGITDGMLKLNFGAIVDIDANGSAEVLGMRARSLTEYERRLARWNRSTKRFEDAGAALGVINPGTDWYWTFADMNGDALPDLIERHWQDNKWYMRISRNRVLTTPATPFGTPFDSRQVGTDCNSYGQPEAQDLDGDGRMEIVGVEAGCDLGIAVGLENTSGASAPILEGFYPRPAQAGRPLLKSSRYADVNGDGLKDRLSWVRNEVWNYHNHGNFLFENVGKSAHASDFKGLRVSDLNRDGRDDLVWNDSANVLRISLSNGDGTFRSQSLGVDAGTWEEPRIGDFNGDGAPDLLKTEGGRLKMMIQRDSRADVITRIYDEATTWPREEIVYSTRLADRAPEIASCSYPVVCNVRNLRVVREVHSRDHLLDSLNPTIDRHSRYYSYEDPRSDLSGRGFLGFGVFRVWDPQRPSETVTTFDRSARSAGKYYPFVGRPKTVTTVVPILSADQTAAKPSAATSARVTKVSNTDEFRLLNGGKNYIVVRDTHRTTAWEETVSIDWGAFSNANTTGNRIWNVSAPSTPARRYDASWDYNDSGHLTHSEKATYLGVSETVDIGYEHRSGPWLLGMPTSYTITRRENGGSANTRRWRFSHDDRGRLEKVEREPDNVDADVRRSTTLAYGDRGELTLMRTEVATADTPAREVHYVYAPAAPSWPDERIYPSQVWSAHEPATYRPSQWSAIHPALGVVLTTMDSNGVTSQTEYDDLARPIHRMPEGQRAEVITYAGRNDVYGGKNGLSVTATNGAQTSRVLTDARHNTISSDRKGFDGSTISVVSRYDVLGRLVVRTEPSTTSPAPHSLYDYDSLDRVLKATNPDKSFKRYEYTFSKRVQWDERNNYSHIRYDRDDRVIQTENSLVAGVPADSAEQMVATVFDYGPFNLIERVIHQQGNATVMTYDAVGRRISVNDPDRGFTTEAYNGFDELRSTTNALGLRRVPVLDDLGRRVQLLDYSGANLTGTTTFTWDTRDNGIGRLAATTSPDGISTEHFYDTSGRVTRTSHLDTAAGKRYDTDITYDGSGRVDTLAYPEVAGRKRFSLKYAYNAYDFVREIGDATPGQTYKRLWTVTSRNAALALTAGTFGNDHSVSQEYDPQSGRLNTMWANAPGGAIDIHRSYSYHANGLLSGRGDISLTRSEIFDYDRLGRLTDWTLNLSPTSTRIRYDYDALGNLTGVRKNGTVIETNGYGKTDGSQPRSLTSATRDGTTSTYNYDLAGRQLQGGGRTMEFAPFDLPRSVTKGGQTWSYAYDSFGTRFKKSGPDGTTVYSSGFELRTGSETTAVFHVGGTDGNLAEVRFAGGTTTVDYVVNDSLGSVVATIGGDGAVTRRLYDPFGKRIREDGTAHSDTGPVRVGFTGHEHEDAVGMINMRGRMYDPNLRRFVTADPFVPHPWFSQSYNRYSYVMNSPLNRVDPSGFTDCNAGDIGCSPGGAEGAGGLVVGVFCYVAGCDDGGGGGGRNSYGESSGSDIVCDYQGGNCYDPTPPTPVAAPSNWSAPSPSEHVGTSTTGGTEIPDDDGVRGVGVTSPLPVSSGTAAGMPWGSVPPWVADALEGSSESPMFGWSTEWQEELAATELQEKLTAPAGVGCRGCVGVDGAFGDDIGTIGRTTVLLAAGGLAAHISPTVAAVLPKGKHFVSAGIGSYLRQWTKHGGDLAEWDTDAMTYDILTGAVMAKYAVTVIKMYPVFAEGAINWGNIAMQQVQIVPLVVGAGAYRGLAVGGDPGAGALNAGLGSVQTGLWSLAGQSMLATPWGLAVFPRGIEDAGYLGYETMVGRARSMATDYFYPPDGRAATSAPK